MSIVSNNIKYLRRLNGLTQEQFARRINIKRSLLGAYEEARANPNLDNLKTIAQVFGTSVDSLIKTDIRKIRDTPSLNQPQTVGQIINSQPFSSTQTTFNGQSIQRITQPTHAPTLRFEPESETQTQPAKTFEDEYLLRSESLKMVATPVTPKRVLVEENFKEYIPEELVRRTEPNFHQNEQSVATHTIPQANISFKTFGVLDNSRFGEYLNHSQNSAFINQLPQALLPNVSGNNLLGFLLGSDFAQKNSIAVAEKLNQTAEIVDGKNYVILSKTKGILFRRIFNLVNIKGVLLLSADVQGIESLEISINDVAEIWKPKAYICTELPEPQFTNEKIKSLVSELYQEMNKV